MTLTIDQIIAADDLKTEVLEIPEWGGTVRIRTMRSRDRDKFEELVTDTKASKVNIRARLAVMTVCDADGKLMFNDSHIEALGNKSASALSKIFNKALSMNNFSTKDVEDLEKN